jgi:hypothetical protein
MDSTVVTWNEDDDGMDGPTDGAPRGVGLALVWSRLVLF